VAIFISPHNDDETLFGAFTILRTLPLVVVVFDSYAQEQRGNPVTWRQRRAETLAACEILGVRAIFLGFSDADPSITAGDVRARLLGALGAYNEAVFAPAAEARRTRSTQPSSRGRRRRARRVSLPHLSAGSREVDLG
jgi:LmbE family N-acetylglucosaminyl deacetylase